VVQTKAQVKRKKEPKPVDPVAELRQKLERITFVGLRCGEAESRLAVTETIDRGAWRSGVLVPAADWAQLLGAQRLARAMLGSLADLQFLPSHAARRGAALLALEVLWGLPTQGWQLCAADVWAWYYRRLSGPELRRRITSGVQEVAS